MKGKTKTTDWLACEWYKGRIKICNQTHIISNLVPNFSNQNPNNLYLVTNFSNQSPNNPYLVTN